MRNRKPDPHYTRFAGLLALCLAPAVVAPAHGQDVRGTVFETDGARRAPSAGAFVIVHWTGRRPGLHYEAVCYQAAIARTDADGRFAIAEPPPLRSRFLVFRNDPAVAVYKPGFDTTRGKDEWTLVATRADPAQRRGLVEILQGYGCPDEKQDLRLTDPQGVLPAFRAALAAESGRK